MQSTRNAKSGHKSCVATCAFTIPLGRSIQVKQAKHPNKKNWTTGSFKWMIRIEETEQSIIPERRPGRKENEIEAIEG